MPSARDIVTTVEELRALPEDGLRHELLDGEHVVTPAPRLVHQWAVTLLFQWLAKVLESEPTLVAMTSPADVVLGGGTLVQPDLFVFRRDPDERLTSWNQVGVPVLTIEVLSPHTAQRDRTQKRRIYQRAGVAEYWIVDVDARVIERWTPGDTRPEVCDGVVRWAPPDIPAAAELDVDGLFRKMLDQ